jgi:zearalenone synthase (highly reducing iterative type I polyketide synthase)
MHNCIYTNLPPPRIFETMTHDNFRASLRPKVQGTWNLHRHLPRDLDFFIMLSSISGITGNPGQANYAAGNTFMDALAHHRREELGLPAVSIDLGLMLDVGFVAERQGVSNLKKWESVGLTEEEYLLIMSAAMRGTLPVVTTTGDDARDGLYEMPAQVVTGLATGGHVAAHGLDDPFYFSDARFKRLVKAELSETTARGASGGGESLSIQQLLAVSTSAAEAADIIAEAIRHRMARVIDKNPENIELGKPLHVYGVDSLMAVEVRNWLAKEMQCSIGLFDVMGSPGIGDLAVKITGLSKLVPKFADES